MPESRRQAIERELAGIDQALADLDRMEEQERRELLFRARGAAFAPSGGQDPGAFAVSGDDQLCHRRARRRVYPRGQSRDALCEKSRQRAAVGRRRRGSNVGILFSRRGNGPCRSGDPGQRDGSGSGHPGDPGFPLDPRAEFSGRLVESTTVDGEFYGRVELDAFDFSLIHRREADVILTTERREGIVVPRSAIVEERGKKGVYILAGDTPVFREVRVLGANERQAVVDGVVGVPVGARVVVNPSRLRTR